MARYSFKPEDRDRFGCDEWLDLDLSTLPIDDCVAIDAAGGDWSVATDGGAAAMKTRAWLALHRAGLNPPPFGKFTYDVVGFRAERSEGKAPSSEGESPAT